MEWIEYLNRAVGYIEGHITEEPDYEKIAREACCSVYHFQRMFGYMAGVHLSLYIRRRRMTLAAAELQNGSSILDVSLKYGYASPTAFNRAFQSVHGVTPSAVKKGGVPLKAYAPILFKITVQGVEEMNYRIEKKDAFRIVGIASPLAQEVEENFAVVPQTWERAVKEGLLPQIVAMMDGEPKGVMGVSACNSETQWKYYIAVASSAPVAAPFDEYTVGAFTWAIFPGAGKSPDAIQELEKRIVTEWLPSSGYEYADGPDVELYISPDPQNAVFEVWIPVTKKKETK